MRQPTTLNISKTKSKKVLFAVVNPRPNGQKLVSAKCAQQAVRIGQAYFTTDGKIYFYPRDETRQRADARALKNSGAMVVSEFSGFDAAPDSSVLPHYPDSRELRARTRQRQAQAFRGPVRPPMATPVIVECGVQQ